MFAEAGSIVVESAFAEGAALKLLAPTDDDVTGTVLASFALDDELTTAVAG